jgi:hypothetical protein
MDRFRCSCDANFLLDLDHLVTYTIQISCEKKISEKISKLLLRKSAKGAAVLTLSLPAVKTQWLSQCQAFRRLVRSSHTVVNWILNNFWSTESIFNQFSEFLKTLNALCVCLQYKHPRSMKRIIRSDKPITSVFPVKSPKCDFGSEPRCRLLVKHLKIVICRACLPHGKSCCYLP